jgi:hypothetical protein
MFSFWSKLTKVRKYFVFFIFMHILLIHREHFLKEESKEYKRIMRIRQEFYPVYGECTDRYQIEAEPVLVKQNKIFSSKIKITEWA